MTQPTRRAFLQNVGAGTVAATLGSDLSADLGFSTAFANAGPDRLTFGPLERLVALMQETPPDRLLPQVIARLRGGTSLRDVTAAAALANARAFGGEDYVGFHTLMALAPAYHMAGAMPEARRALPVLKVIYRNASRLQESGAARRDVLRPLPPTAAAPRPTRDAVRAAVRAAEMSRAEQAFAPLAGDADSALNAVLHFVEDAAEVHRVVLPYRAWDLLGIIGREHAHTLLRQSIHFCVRGENAYRTHYGTLRTLVPRLLERHRLIGQTPGTRTADDRRLEELSQTIYRGSAEQAAEAAAAALAEGLDPAVLGEAISLAANQLVLRDNGRTRIEGPNKPVGSIHGDGIGVHACDSANAWRNLARAADARNRSTCLILGAWQVAHDRASRGGDFLRWEPYPRAAARERVRELAAERLLPALEDAIRHRDQAGAAALAQRYADSGRPVQALWDLLLRYAVSEDGALHGEKFYRTATEEYAATRPAFRNRQLVALARVTASAHGYTAPGLAEANRLLDTARP